MKILLTGLLVVAFVNGHSQISGSKAPTPSTVPVEVITGDSTYWTISTVSTIGYVNNTAGPYYNSYRSGGGMLVKFKFKKNNRFEFQLYVQANTYNISNESWTQVEGTVEFTKDAKGQNVFITKAQKGTYRMNRNGSVTSRPITEQELNTKHSGMFLWERSDLTDDAMNTYLLVVDLKAHPEADINNPRSIDPSWVSKFHIPKN